MKPDALDKLRKLRRDREKLAVESLGRERTALTAAEARERQAEADRDAYEAHRTAQESRLYAAALERPAVVDALERLGDRVSEFAAGSRRQDAAVRERRAETSRAETDTDAAREAWRQRRRDADRLDRLAERRGVARRKAAEIRDDVAAEDEASLTPSGGRS
ncbi:YscO family type III secretion system apparatus protein [Inquilinus sp. Marseille-Q2685]|uniref:type III secretion system stalk subunit SctO n=1 Tax=Inquilinus sp. Marseille-Q2685 TaxID=2866581 RepID=UPI001CE3D795|nr:YscO family type III secretion system apparatus protein [Inquilinus sp. Marseille-Q2685]